MRVAFLTHEPFHPPSGGGSAEALYLVREFVRRGHTVHLFCPEFPNAAAVEADYGVRTHLFARWRMGRYAKFRNLKYLLYPGALAALVRNTVDAGRRAEPDFRFDVLFAQHTISAVAAGRLRRELKTPAVLNFLDYLTGFMETWPAWVMPGPVVRALTRFELSLPRRFDVEGILTVSNPLAERFVATGYPRERVQPIQYGYDAQLFRPTEANEVPPAASIEPSRPAVAAAQLETRSSKLEAPVVLMHGSFDEHHLGPIAREALARVAEARPDVLFRFVGRETPALQRFAARLRASVPGVRLELAGFVPYAEVARQVRSAAVGLVPYEESNGTHCAFVAKAVEYLGCGVPVASTPLENLRGYFADEPAIRFSGFDGISFAAVVLTWLETPVDQRRQLGHAASQRVAAQLDWNIVTRKAVDFVEARLPQ